MIWNTRTRETQDIPRVPRVADPPRTRADMLSAAMHGTARTTASQDKTKYGVMTDVMGIERATCCLVELPLRDTQDAKFMAIGSISHQ